MCAKESVTPTSSGGGWTSAWFKSSQPLLPTASEEGTEIMDRWWIDGRKWCQSIWNTCSDSWGLKQSKGLKYLHWLCHLLQLQILLISDQINPINNLPACTWTFHLSLMFWCSSFLNTLLIISVICKFLISEFSSTKVRTAVTSQDFLFKASRGSSFVRRQRDGGGWWIYTALIYWSESAWRLRFHITGPTLSDGVQFGVIRAANRNTAVLPHQRCRGTRWKASWDLNKSAANDKTDLIFHPGTGEEHIFGLKMGKGALIH